MFHALIIALVIRTLLFQPFNIPSGSMKATLLIGDYLFVSKYSYGYTPLFAAACRRRCSPAAFSARRRARRRRGVPPAEGRLHRLHQARHRLARRPHPDEGRAALHQRHAGQARARRGFHRRRERQRRARAALARDAAQRRELRDARPAGQRFPRQYPGIHGAARPLFHDGRQPRQFDRQPRAVAGRLRAVRKSRSARPRSSSSRSATASRPGTSGAGHGRCAGAGCSRSSDEPKGGRAADANWRRESATSSPTSRCSTAP